MSLFFHTAKGQVLGDKSNKQDWREFSTEAGSFIYPKSIETKAFETALFLNYLKYNNPIRLNTKARKITFILENKSLLSNGYVALAPFRSSLLTTPPQSPNALSTSDWMQLLAIHEERHIQQYKSALHGLTNFAYYLSGESAWSLFQHLSIPNWFYEGDAILSETALTKSGRGRLPHFTVFQRSLAAEGITYNYHKIRNGSYKDLVPDHYRWGYSMLATLTAEKGYDVVQPIIKNAAAYRHIFYPFSRALKKETGYTSKTLYKKSWENSTKAWKEQIADRKISQTSALTDSSLKVVTYYHFPQYLSDSSFVVRKQTHKSTATIVLQNRNGKSKAIAYPAASLEAFFHYKDSFLIWTAQKNNPRRTSETFEDIVLYDMTKNKTRRITKKGRYFSPIVFPKDSLVYALSYGEQQQSALVQIGLNDKKEKTIQSFPPSIFVSRLAIDDEGKTLAYLKRKEGKVAIYTYNLIDKEERQITVWTAHAIDAPRIKGDYVYYGASFNQLNNLYKSPLSGSLEVIQLTEVPLGVYQVDLSPNKEKLIFTEAILNGYKVSELPLAQSENVRTTIVEPMQQRWIYTHLNHDITDKAAAGNTKDTTQFESKAHKGLLRGFKLHSWPITASPAVQEINLLFDNYLNDLSARIGGGYNFNEKGQFYRAEVAYGKWFPILNFWAAYNFRNIEQIGVLSRFTESRFRQKSVGSNILIPLQWQLGNYNAALQTTVGISWRELSNGFEQYKEDFQLANSSLSFSLKRRKALQQLASPLGIQTKVIYGRSIEKLKNEKFQTDVTVFLPSLFKTHSLQLSFGYKRELEENIYQHIDQFSYARGYSYPFSDRYIRYAADYHFPLLYPDWGFGGLTYFKRIRANIFFDYGDNKVFWLNEDYNLSSTGLELYFDNVFLNTFPITFGFRSTYRISSSPFDSSSKQWNYNIMVSSFF